ncbi:MAG: 30S ribosomal protein S3 [Puniceicoccaceae bacterium]|nr:30S ribosomal protein S3 [Puniceicoccaceae bacterium]RCL30946.1 MAG: 30S ribosomal protein S3 [Puniceicoccaceae bacterium]|tara:strand:- start:1 stop:636 length:636 start_codon:yes stop_codon:yes gene_type:complete
MGQKTHPIGFRLAVTKDWDSRWYANKKDFPVYVKEDHTIRTFLEKHLRYASVPRIFIERASGRIRVKIFTARPGIVIGRKGQELDKLKAQLNKKVGKDVMLDIQEVKRPDLSAQLVAENVALQLERRIAFRRAMKRAVQTTMSMGAEGIRIQCSGRLGGADIARTEQQRLGKVPLQTLRANINYGFSEASTVYGIIGVKCWICLPEGEQAL